MNKLNWIIAAIGLIPLAGCGHGPRSVCDPDPADKIPAIQQAARNGDRQTIPYLVADLEDDDPAVRFYAIDALRALTGQDLGYRYYIDVDDRRLAVQRWKQWLAKESTHQK